MANNESSYSDKLRRGVEIYSFIKNFVPAFAPADPDITATGFKTFLDSIVTANNSLAAVETTLNAEVGSRRNAANAIQVTALSIKDHVTSTQPWKQWHVLVSKAADATRGYVLPKKKVAPVAGTPPKKASSGARSQQGYGDIDTLFGKLIESVKKITGYISIPGSGLSVVELEAQREAYQTLNDSVSTAEAAWGTAVDVRSRLYIDPNTGLKAKVMAIKKAVRSQYNSTSSQYAQVKNIKV